MSRADLLKKHGLPDKPLITLMPGSRNQEVRYKLPEMLKVITHFPEYQFVIPASEVFLNNFSDLIKGHNVKVVENDTYALMYYSQAGLIKSGTSVLEAALLNLPQALVYKGNPISVQITRWVAKVKWIGLPNLILNREIVREIIQEEMNENNLVTELKGLLNGPKRNQLLAEYNILQGLLHAGNVSAKIAGDIVRRLQK
jgi:lipid-A-disaccharide synthase